MSGQGGPEGTKIHKEAKQLHNTAATDTDNLKTEEIKCVVEDLISKVVSGNQLDCRRKSDLKKQTRERKRKREEDERER